MRYNVLLSVLLDRTLVSSIWFYFSVWPHCALFLSMLFLIGAVVCCFIILSRLATSSISYQNIYYVNFGMQRVLHIFWRIIRPRKCSYSIRWFYACHTHSLPSHLQQPTTYMLTYFTFWPIITMRHTDTSHLTWADTMR